MTTLKGKLLIDIFKSSHKEEMYLYVEKSHGTSKVPEMLLTQFGKPIHVMIMLLGEDGKQLSRANNAKVMEQIKLNGFYLQMPPVKEKGVLSHLYEEYLSRRAPDID